MMKTGISSSGYIDRYGLEEGVRRLKKHGFECIDYQSFADTDTELFAASGAEFERRLLAVKSALDSEGITVSQTHGPWRWPPRDFTQEDREERLEKMIRSIHGTKLLGCDNFVIHPIMPFGVTEDPEPEKLWDMNYVFMDRLCTAAEKEDVVVCLENMPFTRLSLSRPCEILKFVKNMNRDHFKICLDTGHCSVFSESPAEAVRLIGKDLLRTLHIHDNNGQSDLHWIPYTGVIDWNDFSKALKEIGFDGCVSLETNITSKMPEAARELQEISLSHIAKSIAGRE